MENRLNQVKTGTYIQEGKITKKENRIDSLFNKLRNNGQKALIPFITCGYPTLENSVKLFNILEKNGADIIEIGIPFSDPLADGPVIQEASGIALENGINTDNVMDTIAVIRESSEIPVVIMAYFNTVYRYGIRRFLERAENTGADGLIIPDLPLEEYINYRQYFNDYPSIDVIMLASLTSQMERLQKIAEVCRGFLYCVAVKGVTGAREGISREIKEFLVKLRGIADLPLALGFGISDPSQVLEVRKYCDGIIIGSKILSMVSGRGNFTDSLKKLEKFITEINIILREPGICK